MSSNAQADDYQLDYPFNINWAPEPGEPFEVYPGIYWLHMPIPLSLDRINLWLLKDSRSGEDRWTIVDTGIYCDDCKTTWKKVFTTFCTPESVERIIITHFHPDHLGLAEWLSDKCDCPVLISQGEYAMYAKIRNRDQDSLKEVVESFVRSCGGNSKQSDALFYMSSPMKNKTLPAERCTFIDENFRITIGEISWRIILGNGHSPEHMCFYAEEAGLLISGDQAIPRISSNVSLFHDSVSDNPLLDWLNSCGRLRDNVAEGVLILPSHQEPFIGLQKRMQKLIDGHQKQLSMLEDNLHHEDYRGKSALECTKILFPRKLEKFDTVMAVGETLANLRYLERQGRIKVEADDAGVSRFYPNHH